MRLSSLLSVLLVSVATAEFPIVSTNLLASSTGAAKAGDAKIATKAIIIYLQNFFIITPQNNYLICAF